MGLRVGATELLTALAVAAGLAVVVNCSGNDVCSRGDTTCNGDGGAASAGGTGGAGGTAPTGGTTTSPAACDDSADADGDGIADSADGTEDFDGDGKANKDDPDSDDDGLKDKDENDAKLGGDPCMPLDTDKDGKPNYLDWDSDGDFLLDEEEGGFNTHPFKADSDKDGYSDAVEALGAGTNPNNAKSYPKNAEVFVVPSGESTERPVSFRTTKQKVDVMFLFDSHDSMLDERKMFIETSSDILNGIRDEIGDAQFGVAAFDNYPVKPDSGAAYGQPGNRPFVRLLEISDPDRDTGAWSRQFVKYPSRPAYSCPDNRTAYGEGRIDGSMNTVPDLFEAIEGIPCHVTMSPSQPTSAIPALYALATKTSPKWYKSDGAVETTPLLDCASDRRGGGCFRKDADPVVCLITDEAFNNGPPNCSGCSQSYPYNSDKIYQPPSYKTTVDALKALKVKVVGVASTGNVAPTGGGIPRGLAHLGKIARETGAVDAKGDPIVRVVSPVGGPIQAEGGTADDSIDLTEAVQSAVLGAARGKGGDLALEIKSIKKTENELDARRFVSCTADQLKSPTSPYPYEPRSGKLARRPDGTWVDCKTAKDLACVGFNDVPEGTTLMYNCTISNKGELAAPEMPSLQIFQVELSIQTTDQTLTYEDKRVVFILIPPKTEAKN